jgi:N-acetylneuraminic acid mutarotase
VQTSQLSPARSLEVPSLTPLPPATFQRPQDTLYVFGGCYEADEGSGNAVIYSSDLHAYDAETGFWTRKLPSPLQPCARAGHCMIGTGSSFYVICGRTTIEDKTTFLGDVFVFDTLDKIWSPVRTAGPNPVGRAHASACYLRGSIYLFGGCNGTVASSYRNDIMILSLENLTWTKCVPDSPLPAGRAQHSMVASGGILYVFGGSNLKHGRKNALGDLNTFNTIKKQWTQLVDTGQGVLCPEPRWGHVMFEIKGGLFVFAGVGSHENEDENGNERLVFALQYKKLCHGSPQVLNTVSRQWFNSKSPPYTFKAVVQT